MRVPEQFPLVSPSIYRIQLRAALYMKITYRHERGWKFPGWHGKRNELDASNNCFSTQKPNIICAMSFQTFDCYRHVALCEALWASKGSFSYLVFPPETFQTGRLWGSGEKGTRTDAKEFVDEEKNFRLYTILRLFFQRATTVKNIVLSRETTDIFLNIPRYLSWSSDSWALRDIFQ